MYAIALCLLPVGINIGVQALIVRPDEPDRLRMPFVGRNHVESFFAKGIREQQQQAFYAEVFLKCPDIALHLLACLRDTPVM